MAPRPGTRLRTGGVQHVQFGNVHGFYHVEPRWDFARLREIRARVDVPEEKIELFGSASRE